MLSFSMDQDYIARELCINRNQPEKLCSGKCVLDQMFQDADKSEKKALILKLKYSEVAFCEELPHDISQLLRRFSFVRRKVLFNPCPLPTSGYAAGVFKPPGVGYGC